MKKTAIFLVITLLSTMLSGVISVSAAEWVETFPLSATEETVILGHQFTDCILGKNHTSIGNYYIDSQKITDPFGKIPDEVLAKGEFILHKGKKVHIKVLLK